jgi:predicted dehydrogenase
MNVIRVGMIGHKFMGKAHTHGYTDLPLFFDPGVDVQKRTLCAREASVADTARRWGWQSWTHDWRTVVEDPEIDLVDIAAPSVLSQKYASLK